MYALVPFTVMSIGTFLIVYRVYYQERRFFRSRRTYTATANRTTTNKAKSLFYLLFTLNLLYFVLVSPVVFVTTILFRDPNEEVSYPRLKATIYLMQYANHSLNFIFYGKLSIRSQIVVKITNFVIFVGITSPPYRKTLLEWLEAVTPYLPQCCQTLIKRPTATTKQPVNGQIIDTTKPRTFSKHEKRKMLPLASTTTAAATAAVVDTTTAPITTTTATTTTLPPLQQIHGSGEESLKIDETNSLLLTNNKKANCE